MTKTNRPTEQTVGPTSGRKPLDWPHARRRYRDGLGKSYPWAAEYTHTYPGSVTGGEPIEEPSFVPCDTEEQATELAKRLAWGYDREFWGVLNASNGATKVRRLTREEHAAYQGPYDRTQAANALIVARDRAQAEAPQAGKGCKA
jgi:hypothetical protein